MNRQLIGRQRGVALAVALIFLMVLTVVGVYAASGSALGLRMAKNMQDSFSSFQAAEAIVAAVLTVSRIGTDPFDGVTKVNNDPLGSKKTDLLGELGGGVASIDASVELILPRAVCPRMEKGSSADLIACDHYRIDGEHETDAARTRVSQGIVKSIIGNAAL